ncbi:MAG: diadenylate cyclase CdaA [Spirochaetia bacterium]|jgi:diadenylate cyclase|nr:diadenylate cyclase CdaA [Spirochaetia bacterium]
MTDIFGKISLYFSDFWNSYFRHVVDIALVGALFYLGYSLLNKTRAIQLIKGFIVIFVVAILSNLLRLDTIDWIIKNITTSLFITVIVVFQPELRHLITQFGQRHWLTSDMAKKSFPLDELVNSIFSMANEKVVSLIVIERNTGLKSYVESGVEIDSDISEELIRTVFFPLTPLHDGAVIIQDGRIAAAACYLPLSDSKQLKKQSGARHRAALGIAEESDALVLVTSEENGTVSVMVNGKMYSRIKDSDLKNIILFYMNPKTAYEEYKI